MAQSTEELVVGANGSINVAPYGTTLPQLGDDPTESLNAAFQEMGLANEDGVTFANSREIEEFRSWQMLDASRREVTGRSSTLSFTLQQWNEDTVAFAFGGGTVTDHGLGIYSYSPPVGTDALDERSVVVDWADGDRHYRVVVPRGNVTDETETQLQRAALSEFPITFSALGVSADEPTWYLLTDDPSFGASS